MTLSTLTEGQPEPLGASLTQTGLNVAVVSTRASAIAVSVFDASDREIARLPLLGRTGDGWLMTGIDAEGLDLRHGGETARLAFEKPIDGPEQARTTLAALAQQARKRIA